MKLTNRKILGISLGLTGLVLLIFLFLRFLQGNPLLAGQFSYFNLYLLKEGLFFDSQFFNPGLLIMFLAGYLLEGVQQLVIIFIFGLGSVWLFHNLLRKSRLNEELRLIILLLAILSPVFIFIFTTLNHYACLVFLILLGLNLLQRPKGRYLACMVFLILPFFDVFTSILALILLLVYWLITKDKFVYVLLGLVVFITIILQFIFPSAFYWQPLALEKNLSLEFFSDLGGEMGFGIFFLLLSLLGLIVTWKKSKVYYLIYGTIIFLIGAFILLDAHVNIYLNFVLAILAGQGLFWLWKRKWKFNLIKNLSLLILVFGILFSTFSYVNQMASESPTAIARDSLLSLKNQSREDEIIFSHPEKSFWIMYWAERPVYLNYFSDDFQEKNNMSKTAFYSRDVETTLDWFETNNVTYIWIDREMRQGQVWETDEQGLLFLFRGERFKNIYNSEEGIEVWKFI